MVQKYTDSQDAVARISFVLRGDDLVISWVIFSVAIQMFLLNKFTKVSAEFSV